MSRIAHGQVAVTGTAAQLSSTATKLNSLIIKAHSANAANVYIGEAGVTTSTGYELVPGEEFIFTPDTNLNKMPLPTEVYVVGTSGDDVSWIGTRR